MTLKIFEALKFQEAISILSSQKMPLKTAFKLNKILSLLQQSINFYTENFTNIINEYGKKTEDGNLMTDSLGQNILIKEDKLEECQDKLNELSNLEINLSNEEDLFISIEDLGNIDCSISELQGLMPFLRD